MTQDVVNLLFGGDSAELLPRYAEGIRQYQAGGGRAPDHLVVAHGPDGLHVTLVWPEGVDHEVLGNHMRGLIRDLGLPMPTAHHGTLATVSWRDLTA